MMNIPANPPSHDDERENVQKFFHLWGYNDVQYLFHATHKNNEGRSELHVEMSLSQFYREDPRSFPIPSSKRGLKVAGFGTGFCIEMMFVSIEIMFTTN
jgi:hypothetical protein